jgi:hypothetical protein
MSVSRSFLARLALLVVLILSPTMLLGRIHGALAGGVDERGASGQRAIESEVDADDLEAARLAAASPLESRTRGRRLATNSPETSHRFVLVADLRPTRLTSPVQHPPLRPRLLRLLN